MHLKRQEMLRTWPLRKKGTKYIVRTLHDLNKAIPLLVVLRDILKIAGNRKEAKKLIELKKVKINGKVAKEEKFPLSLFDNLTLDGKNLKLVFKNKKFALVDAGKEAEKKIAKVIGKKVLSGEKTQINLSDGKNFLTKEKIKVGDSVAIDLKENKICEILPLKEKAKIIFISGRRLGEEGKIEKIGEKVEVNCKGSKINCERKNLMVIK